MEPIHPKVVTIRYMERKWTRAVVAGEVEKGILICGTGLGISLAANK